MRHIVVVACAATVAIACSDSPTGLPEYQPPPRPPLEAVPFDQVGSGTFVFMRHASGPPSHLTAYVIDGLARRSFPALESSDWLVDAPSVAPDGRRVAFLGYSSDLSAAYDVYVANLDGTGEQRAASFGSNSEGPPSWTPNGSQIAFVVDSGGAVSIYRQSPVSSPADRVLLRKFTVAADGSLVCPFMFRSDGPISVSVDGAIALNCLGREIDVVEADGRVTAAYTASARPAGHLSVVHAPAWSPDGSRLAFLEETRETSGFETVSTSVITVEPSSGARTVVATVPTTGARGLTAFGPFSLCWLPGGSGIMFTAPDGQETSHVFTAAIQNGVVTRVTSAPNVLDHSVSCSR